MSFIRNPKLLLGLRVSQLLFDLGFIVLLGWSNSNPGYWTNLQGSVAIGVIAFLATLLAGFHAVYEYFRHVEHCTEGWKRYLRVAGDAVVMLLWIGTATLMLHSPEEDLLVKLLSPPIPQVEWDLGIAFTFFEVASFISTAVLLFLRGSSKSKAIYPTPAAYV